MARRPSALALAVVILWAPGAVVRAEDWPQWGRRWDRNMVCPSLMGLPAFFQPGQPASDVSPAIPAVNIKWAARLGTQTYGNPTLAGGKVFVGTNNGQPRNRLLGGDRAVLMCLRASDGQFLWQLAAPKRHQSGSFNGDYPGLGICSSPTVDSGHVYVVTSRGEVACLGLSGMQYGNQGPFVDEDRYLARPLAENVTPGPRGPVIDVKPGRPVRLGPTDADIIWLFDMMKEVGTWPQDASSCSVLIVGDLLYVGTSNGVDVSHKKVPFPQAPSFIVLNKNTGRLVAADDAGIGPHIFHGQWSSPAYGVVKDRPLVFYGAGDGFLYAFDAHPQRSLGPGPGVLKTAWRCDANPPEYRVRNGKRLPYGAKAGPSEIIGTPVLYKDRIYVTIGQDPRHGQGKGCLTCMDATLSGDVSVAGVRWRYTAMNRSLSTPSIADGLLYVADFAGALHCLDAETGQVVWTHSTGSAIWGSTLVADHKVYLGTEKGQMWVFRAGRQKQVLNTIWMGSPVYTTPIAAGGVLYVASQKWLYAVTENGR